MIRSTAPRSIACCKGRRIESWARRGCSRTGARWLAVALLSFGRPGSEGDRYAVAAGLKRRPAAAVMGDFLDDIQPAVARAGLTFPAPAMLPVALTLELSARLV